ncbi:hypothetical protein AB0N19_28960, partial [Streptomyces sp. NPDC051132]
MAQPAPAPSVLRAVTTVSSTASAPAVAVMIAEPGDDAEDDEDRLFIEDGLIDLEPVLRDA